MAPLSTNDNLRLYLQTNSSSRLFAPRPFPFLPRVSLALAPPPPAHQRLPPPPLVSLPLVGEEEETQDHLH